MAIQGFVINQVNLGGCEPLNANCGLTAEEVAVRIGDESYDLDSSGFVTYCSAKIGRLACETCELSLLMGMEDMKTEFTVSRSMSELDDPRNPHLRVVRRQLPAGLAAGLFCERETDT